MKEDRYYVRPNNETESYRVYERNGITTEKGFEDAVVADFHETAPIYSKSFADCMNGKCDNRPSKCFLN